MKNEYWIRTTIDLCPICGSEKITKERVAGPKPADAFKRVVLNEIYDYCDAV